MMMPANAGGSPGHHQRPISQLLPKFGISLTNPPSPTMVTTMRKHQRKHTKQAISRDYRNRMGESITVTFKRRITPLRAMLVDDVEIQWQEIRLVHQLRKFI